MKYLRCSTDMNKVLKKILLTILFLFVFAFVCFYVWLFDKIDRKSASMSTKDIGLKVEMSRFDVLDIYTAVTEKLRWELRGYELTEVYFEFMEGRDEIQYLEFCFFKYTNERKDLVSAKYVVVCPAESVIKRIWHYKGAGKGYDGGTKPVETNDLSMLFESGRDEAMRQYELTETSVIQIRYNAKHMWITIGDELRE